MFGKSGQPESGITLIANNCEVQGDIHFSDQLMVNGTVKGNIYATEGSKAVVNVSEKGQVKGEIRAPRIVVNGKVVGDIYAGKHIELQAKAEITGNVYYNLIEMVMGSRVDGNLVHAADGKEQAAGKKAAGGTSSPAASPGAGPKKAPNRAEPAASSDESDTAAVSAVGRKPA